MGRPDVRRLFGGGPGRDYYVLVRNDGLAKTGFEVRYRQSRVGNVPWELLYDTEDGVFLVQQFASFSRLQHSSTGKLSEPRPAGGELNVLLVIARPYGQRDVPYRTVARPVMELLSRPRLRERIRVEVLRPPTFQRFQEELKRTRGAGRPFFDVVHFDGHGGFGISLEAAARLDVFDAYKGPHGKLLFENADGGEHRVEADELRRWLGRHKVPLVVLNACRSGMEALEDTRAQQLLAALAQAQEGADLDVESLRRLLAGQNEEIQSVAGTLLNAGADGVVAMGYVVRARAAAIFIRHFYARLLAGGSAAEAVKAGRMALVEERARPTRFGDQDLQDWPIPVYHERLPVRLFEPPAESEVDALFAKLTAGEAEASAPVEEALPAAPFHGFAGRDVELLEIERVLGREDAAGVEIVGLGGNGKTALAVGTARWLWETHAPHTAKGVYFHAFVDWNERGEAVHPGLPQMVLAIGRRRFGEDFLRRGAAEQRRLVEKHLREEPCLLILDNVEAARGLGEQPALIDGEELAEWRAFLPSVCRPRGSTCLLLTSRRREDWLDVSLEPLELGGLDREAAEELAVKVLRRAMGQARLDSRLEDPDWRRGYEALLTALGGHPIALQIILPHLEDRDPETVLRSFDEGATTLDRELSTAASERERTLAGCLGYSFSTLSAEARLLLPFLAFFRDSVVVDLLGAWPEGHEIPPRLRDASAETWTRVLTEAVSTGLVTRRAETPIFDLHPLLPWFLAAELADREDMAELEQAFRRWAAGMAGALYQSFEQGGTAQAAVSLFAMSRSTLLYALTLSRRAKELEEIGPQFRCLYTLLEHTGQKTPAEALREELAREWKPGGELDPSSLEGTFWLDLELKKANALLESRDFAGAEGVYQEIVEAAGESGIGAASVFHQMGVVAQEKSSFGRTTSMGSLYHITNWGRSRGCNGMVLYQLDIT